MIDATKHHRMIEALTEAHGEEVAMTLAESLRTDHLATKADLEPLATKADLANLRIATKADLANLRIATTADIKNLETRIDGIETRIDNCATKEDLASAFGQARSELASAFGQARSELATTAGQLSKDIAAVAKHVAVMDERLDKEVSGAINRQLRWMVGTMLAFLGVMVSAIGVAGAFVVQAINSTPLP